MIDESAEAKKAEAKPKESQPELRQEPEAPSSQATTKETTSKDETPANKTSEVTAESIEADYQAELRMADQWTGSNPEMAAKIRKAAGMKKAAAMRKLTGKLTSKEQQAKDKKEASNYTGKPVSVDGKNGKVSGVAFGKVKVDFEDGTKRSFESDQIQPPQAKSTDTTEDITEETQVDEATTEEESAIEPEQEPLEEVEPPIPEKTIKPLDPDFIDKARRILTKSTYEALALNHLKASLKGIDVTLTSTVAETGESATYSRPASEVLKEAKTEKSAYDSILNCLGGKA